MPKNWQLARQSEFDRTKEDNPAAFAARQRLTASSAILASSRSAVNGECAVCNCPADLLF
jgi:hypothetical protein